MPIQSVRGRLFERTIFVFVSFDFFANMKSYLAACFVVVAMSTFAILGDAQSTLPPVTAQPAVILKVKAPVTANPHNCDCKGECKKVQHSQVPFKNKVTPSEF